MPVSMISMFGVEFDVDFNGCCDLCLIKVVVSAS